MRGGSRPRRGKKRSRDAEEQSLPVREIEFRIPRPRARSPIHAARRVFQENRKKRSPNPRRGVAEVSTFVRNGFEKQPFAAAARLYVDRGVAGGTEDQAPWRGRRNQYTKLPALDSKQKVQLGRAWPAPIRGAAADIPPHSSGFARQRGASVASRTFQRAFMRWRRNASRVLLERIHSTLRLGPKNGRTAPLRAVGNASKNGSFGARLSIRAMWFFTRGPSLRFAIHADTATLGPSGVPAPSSRLSSKARRPKYFAVLRSSSRALHRTPPRRTRQYVPKVILS